MTVRKRWRNPAVLCAVCALAFLGTAHVANAQTSPSAMLDQFRAVRMTWLTVAAGYANRLFGLLALIEFAWTAAILVLERTDLQGWTAALIRKMMFIGAFFALLNFGADWIPRIINSFQQIGQNASGLGSLAPTDILVQGLNITGNLLSGAASSGWLGNIGTALSLVFAALLAFLAFLGLTVVSPGAVVAQQAHRLHRAADFTRRYCPSAAPRRTAPKPRAKCARPPAAPASCFPSACRRPRALPPSPRIGGIRILTRWP